MSLRTIVATSAGLTLASSTFVAAVQVAGFVLGDTAWLAILISGLLCFLAAACFSELNGLMPTAAGIRLYFSRAYNDKVSLIVSLMYMMIIIIGVVGAESYILSRVLNDAFPAIPPYAWIFLMLLAVTAMNIRGIKIAGVFQDIITYGLVGSLLVFSTLALYKVNFELKAPLSPGGIEGIISAVALGIFLFVGFEWVTPLAEEVTQVKQISKGMMIALGILSVTYALFTVAMTALVPKEILAASAAPHVIFARTALGEAGAAWMVALTLMASITTFNAGLISVSRFMYASAREHVIPHVFSTISLRYFTPWVAIVTIFGVALVVAGVILATHRYMVLVEMAAAMESLVYALVGLAVLRLRRKMPDELRPYKIAGGFLIPALTLLIFAVLAIAVLGSSPWALLWMAIAFIACLIYVNTAVPYLKKKQEALRPASRRRPARVTDSVESK